MRITLLFSLALSAALVLSSGCAPTQTGGVTPGMPLTKDTITSKYEKPVPMLTAATHDVLTRNGQMIVENIVDHTFQAKVNQHNVWVKVADLDGKITVVTVQARGPMGGDIDLAAEISKQIALQLMAGQK
jgi:hypothetical protein